MDAVLALVERISFLAAMPSVGGLFVAMGMLFLTRRWQVQISGMTVLYFFVALLHTRVIRPEVALVKVLIGWLICLTLYVTARSIDPQRRKTEESRKEERPERRRLPGMAVDTPLRILVLLVVLVIAYTGAVYFSLPQVPDDVGLACYLLGVGGLFLVGIAEEPLPVGLGLLTFLAGFDLFFGALEPSLVVAGLLGASGFLIALAVTFLAVTHAAVTEERS